MARPEGQWMPLYWGDYLKKTARFTLAHHGAYMLLMAEYWTSAKPIPADPDEQALISRVPVKDWLKLRPKIAEKFDERDGLWHHERIDFELAKASANYAARAKAGAEGAAKRWQKNSNAIAEPLANDCQKDAPSPSHSPDGENHLPSEDVRTPPKSAKGLRLSPDWKPSLESRTYATERNLTDAEIDGTALPKFIRIFTSPDLKKPVRKGWDRTWCNFIDDEAPRIVGNRNAGGRSKGHTFDRPSVVAARDRILAKAGVRHEENDGPTDRSLRTDAPGWAESDRTSGGNPPTILDADEWQRVPRPADGTEGHDAAITGHDGRSGGPTNGVSETLHGIPIGCSPARSENPAGNVSVVAGVGRTEGAAGNSQLPPADDDRMPEIPEFLRRA